MPLALVRDVIQRYAAHQNDIDAILAPSRREHGNASRFCRSIRTLAFGGHAADQFERADNAARMADMLGGKFGAINMATWSRIGTVEFRQRKPHWKSSLKRCLLIDAMFRYSDLQRLDYTAPQTATVATPDATP